MQITSDRPAWITKTTIDSVWRRRETNVRLIMRDKDCRGLALIVSATSMTWTFAYRPRGADSGTGRRWPNRTVATGNPATHSSDDARAETNRIKGQAAAGADPAVEKRARAAEEQRQRAATLARLLENDYIKALRHRPKMRGVGLPSLRYVSETLAQAKQAIDDMEASDKLAAHLTAADLRRVLSITADRTPIAQRRVETAGQR